MYMIKLYQEQQEEELPLYDLHHLITSTSIHITTASSQQQQQMNPLSSYYAATNGGGHTSGRGMHPPASYRGSLPTRGYHGNSML